VCAVGVSAILPTPADVPDEWKRYTDLCTDQDDLNVGGALL
jgi:hypothetical protein